MQHRLTPDIANRFAEIALGHVTREYPHKLDQVLEGPEDLESPRALHPIFFGSFDWHSCVHGYWLLLRTLRLFPDMPVSVRIRTLADEMLAPDKVAGELAYLDRAYTSGFERPYGWGWLLALHGRETLAPGTRPVWGAQLEQWAALRAEDREVWTSVAGFWRSIPLRTVLPAPGALTSATLPFAYARISPGTPSTLSGRNTSGSRNASSVRR